MMKYKELGKTGLQASVIGLGTFEIGGSSWWDPVDRRVAVNTIRNAIDLGINFVDTAPVYGFGQSEKIVGEAIQDIRESVLLCTKIGEEFSGMNEGRFHYNHDGKSVYTCLKPDAIQRQLEESLRNLKTDYIDVLMPHFFFDDPSVGQIDDIMESMFRLIHQGKIRSVGLSNVFPNHFQKFIELGQSKIACVQLYTNVLDHGLMSNDILKQAVAEGISGVGINCLAKGVLAGAFPDDYQVREGSERSESPWFHDGRIARVNQMLDSWSALRDKHGVSSASLSLAWVLAQRGISHLLTGVTNFEHVLDAARASEIELSVDELQLMTVSASALRIETVESLLEVAAAKVHAIAESGRPVAIWGGGVTLDYICRRLPLASCNIVEVFDSNPKLSGQIRFGRKIKSWAQADPIDPSTVLLVAIPKPPEELNAILKSLSIGFDSVCHLGYLKALCK
ncbi:aldo/keto reductase [beta proteobacterium MWH-UniP1]